MGEGLNKYFSQEDIHVQMAYEKMTISRIIS